MLTFKSIVNIDQPLLTGLQDMRTALHGYYSNTRFNFVRSWA